jgi:hypothetical protein
MELQAEAERRKRASILESEGQRQAKINIAEGNRAEVILASEASQQDQINRATGEAEAIFRRAEATSRGIQLLAESIRTSGGPEAVSLRVAEQYLDAFGEIAKKGTTMLLPAAANDPASMMAQALSIFKSVSGKESRLPQEEERPGEASGGGVTTKNPETESRPLAAGNSEGNLRPDTPSGYQASHFSLQRQ